MIEVLATTLLVGLIVSAVATAMIATSISAADSRHHSQASQIAEQDQERLRGLSASQLTGLSQSRVVTADGTAYNVNSTASFLSSSGTSSCGAPGAGAAAYYQVTSTVTWAANLNPATGANREPPVVAESIITPPAGGTLLAQVVDQTGAGLPGVTVSASGPSYGSGMTDAGGCTELADLQAGSYTATFTDTGYVDPTGNPAPTSAASVTATGTSRPTSNPITMGLAGAINATFTSTGLLGGLTSQQATAISYFGNGTSSRMSSFQTYPAACLSSPSSCTTPAGTQPASGTVSLFPFEFTGPSYTGNYQVWAGPCEQNEPPASIDKFTVGPGSSQTLSVQEPALDVLVLGLGLRVAPISVSLSFQSTTGPSCSDTWYPTLTGNPLTNVDGVLESAGEPFASIASSGATASASGYTGTYTICASASILGSTRRLTVSGVTNTNFASPTVVTLNILASSTHGSC